MGPFDFFSAIYCINCSHRADRREHAQAQFEKIGITNKVIWFEGISGGNVGCTKSHIAITQLAKEQGLPNVLVFEDDVEFLDITPLEVALAHLGTFDLFYLGILGGELRKESSIVRCCGNGGGTHAVCYAASTYDHLNSYFQAGTKFEVPIDRYLADYWQIPETMRAIRGTEGRCFAPNPIVAIQSGLHSDIADRGNMRVMSFDSWNTAARLAGAKEISSV